MAAGQTKAETAPAGDKPDTKKRLGRGLSALLGDTNALRRQTAEREGCATIFNPLEGAQPDDADSAITDQTLLAELRFANPCAPGAVDGVLTFDPIAATTAIAAGTELRVPVAVPPVPASACRAIPKIRHSQHWTRETKTNSFRVGGELVRTNTMNHAPSSEPHDTTG